MFCDRFYEAEIRWRLRVLLNISEEFFVWAEPFITWACREPALAGEAVVQFVLKFISLDHWLLHAFKINQA